MKLFVTSITALGLVLTLGVVSTPEALAKAHDQGATQNASETGKEKAGLDTPNENPGDNVQSETVGPAQGLGAALGQSGNAGGQNAAGASGGNEGVGSER